MIADSDVEELLRLLQSHATLASAPRSELEWLVRQGERRRYAAGTLVVSHSDEVKEMMVMLAGRLAVHFEHGAGRRHTVEARAGTVTGAFPYSRIKTPQGDVVAEEPVDCFVLASDRFPALVRECPVITATLVHAMLDRARRFSAVDWQDEKIMSLGRLAAGLAHELNNPASGATRSAELLDGAVTDVGAAAFALGGAGLTAAQLAAVTAMAQSSAGTPDVASPLERADREDEVSRWLDAHAADPALAPALAEAAVTVGDLDGLASTLGGGSLDPALRWIAAARTARSLAADVRRATGRIHDLVSSVTRFTHVDRAGVAAAVDLTGGLTDTVAILASKAKAKSAKVSLRIDGGLPKARVMVAELNQVWANLLENAIDAVDVGGTVAVHANATPDAVIVRVIDDGPGIPADVQARMFEPFFTTKRIGEGTGLGLDIALRIVRGHDGDIEVDTRRGRTEFRVRIPIDGPARAGSAQVG